MPEHVQSSEKVSSFLDRFYQAVSPHLQECFSEETKQIRNLSLALGLLLVLLSQGTVTLQEDAEFWGFKAKVVATTLARTLVALELFFLLILGTRCFVEWKAWRIRLLSPQWLLARLNFELDAEHYGRMVAVAELQQRLLTERMSSKRAEELAAELSGVSASHDAKIHSELSGLVSDTLPTVAVALRIRLFLEAVFPILFGTLAVVLYAL